LEGAGEEYAGAAIGVLGVFKLPAAAAECYGLANATIEEAREYLAANKRDEEKIWELTVGAFDAAFNCTLSFGLLFLAKH
jgi:hypothetical protein